MKQKKRKPGTVYDQTRIVLKLNGKIAETLSLRTAIFLCMTCTRELPTRPVKANISLRNKVIGFPLSRVQPKNRLTVCVSFLPHLCRGVKPFFLLFPAAPTTDGRNKRRTPRSQKNKNVCCKMKKNGILAER